MKSLIETGVRGNIEPSNMYSFAIYVAPDGVCRSSKFVLNRSMPCCSWVCVVNECVTGQVVCNFLQYLAITFAFHSSHNFLLLCDLLKLLIDYKLGPCGGFGVNIY
jgi:hypothetical protein